MSLTQYYTATSLDGFIADPNHSLDWLFTREREPDGPFNHGGFIAGVGAIAMGSTTYVRLFLQPALTALSNTRTRDSLLVIHGS